MENINPILNELKEISPFVAAIGSRPTYTAPEGYFDGLAIQVILRIALEEKAGIDPVLNINKDNVYDAPKGYFDSLAGNIMNRIKAAEAVNPNEELELLSPLLNKIGKRNPFSSPEGYFNDFSDNIVAGVKAVEFVNEELENLSPVMLELKGKLVYEVPEGYFENNVAIILDKAKTQQPAKVISIGFGKRVMRYAAAAVVVGIIAVSGYVISNKPDKVPGGQIASATTLDSATVAKIPDQEIENFINNSSASIDDAGSLVNTDDDISDKDSKDLLANISDAELQQYATDQHIETPITN